MYKSLTFDKTKKALPIVLYTLNDIDRVIYLNKTRPQPKTEEVKSEDAMILKSAVQVLDKYKIKMRFKQKDDTSVDDNAIIELSNPAAKFFPIPNRETREVLYVVGPSGSGKSYFTAEYVQLYKTMFPDNPVYLVSSKPIDETLDDLDVNRIDEKDILEEFADDAGDYTEYADSLVIFDDIDGFRRTKYEKPVYCLRDKLLKNARSIDTYVICTNHAMFESSATKAALDEAHQVVMFCGGGSDESIRNWFRRKAGLDKKIIDEIMSLPSRWICFNTHNPRYVTWECGVKIL